MHIRIVSPSGKINEEYIDQASARLRAWGYKVSEGKFARGEWGGYAGTPEQRLADLNDAFSDETVDIVLCSRGGYGLAQIIDKVIIPKDFHKLLIGFSDITCLHNLLGTRNIPSLHAIMVKHIATLSEESYPIQALRAILQSGRLEYNLPAHPLNRCGESIGMLRGGNLSVFYGLQGTPWAVRANNGILFIEDIAEAHHHIDRMMQNLRLSGVLNEISGLVVGQFSDCKDDERQCCTIYESILNAMRDTTCPILFNFPAGHVEMNVPLLMNTMTHLQVTPNGATLSMNC